MQPETNNPSQKIRILKISFPRSHIRILILVGAAVILASIAGGYLLLKNNSGSGIYSYTYKDLNSYAMPGDAKGNGISLQKPVDLTTPGAIPAKQTQAYLNHTTTINTQSVTMAQVFLATVNAGTELKDGYKKNIGNTITDPKNAGHEAAIKPIKDFVTQRLNTILGITFSEAKALNTSNIKANAWYLTFTATPKDAKDKATQPDVSGQVILAIGKTTFYYIALDSLSSNWQSNQKVWDQVINSVKLDQ